MFLFGLKIIFLSNGVIVFNLNGQCNTTFTTLLSANTINTNKKASFKL